ncbi:MAG: 30S ribosomal protein S20 [Clostridia bacterium]
MPNIKSAMKRTRTSAKKNLNNSSKRSALRKDLKAAKLALGTNAEDAKLKVLKAMKALDSAANKGLIHKNKAARNKSKLATALNKLG